jgi:OOP family OmpA-OmpF porin
MRKLITVLFCSICLFFVSCTHDPKPEPTPLPPAPIPQPEVKKEIVVIHFHFDSAKLGKFQKKTIAAAVKNMAPGSEVKVVGYTDSQGKKKYNEKLSLKRAKAVATYLEKKLKVDAKLITLEAKGETVLLNKDKTIKEHKANRRAHVTLELQVK